MSSPSLAVGPLESVELAYRWCPLSSVCVRPCSACSGYSVNNVDLCHVNDCVFSDKMAVFRTQTASFHSILLHRSLGGPIDIFPVTVTSVHAVADLTEKM